MTQRKDGGLRADAAQNKERLLAAAREVFAEHGLGVSLRQIARHAGVSEPTLRRRFATREELIAEAFADKVVDYADAAAKALQDPDPWVGFTLFLRSVAQMQLVDRGFAEVLTLTFPATMRQGDDRRRAWDNIQQMISRAKAAGRLREDFVSEDIVMLLMAHAGLVTASGRIAESMSARLLGYLLQAFAAPGAASLPPAPSVAATYQALLQLDDNRR